MTIILLIGFYIAFGLIAVMLPFGIIGWLTRGFRPFATTLVLWLIAVFIFSLWQFSLWALPLQYLLALMGYTYGARIRTGKEIEQIMATDNAPNN